MSSISPSLNPNAAEFVPSFLVNHNISSIAISNNNSSCIYSNHTKQARFKKERSQRNHVRNVSEPELEQPQDISALCKPAVSPYLSALKSEPVADAKKSKPYESLQSIPAAAPKVLTYEQELLKWRSRRITTVDPSVTNKWKARWLEIARDSSKLTAHASGSTASSGAASGAGSPDVVSTGPISAWHSILGHGPYPQSQQHLQVSNAALRAAEASHKDAAASIGFRMPAGMDNVYADSYVRWWSAVLGAGLAAMTALLDTKYQWDSAFSTELFYSTSNARVIELPGLSGSNLLIAPSNVDVDISGLHALHVCSLLPTHALLLEQLLQYDAVQVNIDLRERKHKRTAVHYAALAGNLEGLRILVSYGIDLEAKDRSGNSVLHIACKQNYPTMVAFVCDKARRLVNAGNKASETAILLTRSREVAQLLIAAGADVTCRNAEGLDAATLAAQAGHTSLLQVLLTSNSSHQKAVSGTTATVVAAKYKNFSTPLHAAASNGHLSCVRLLLSLCPYNKPSCVLHSCGIHTLDRPAYRTALMCAALHGHAEVFAALVLHGADPKTETVSGVTALVMAVASPLVPVDFISAVCRGLTPVGGSERVAVEALLQDNSSGQSLLCSALQQVTRAARIDIRQRQQVVAVMEPYWPKIIALLAAGAPLRSDFLSAVAHPQCFRYLAQSGLDLRRPLHEWRTVLNEPINWDETTAGLVQSGSVVTATADMHISVSSQCSAAPAIGKAKSYTVELLSTIADELCPSKINYGDGLGQPDVRIIVAGSSTQQSQELHAHSMILRSDRAGVLQQMVQSEMVAREWVSTADGSYLCTVLSFPNIDKLVLEQVLWWIYTGRDVCYQLTTEAVVELLYVANELLVQGLQQLCEAHICLRHSEIGRDAIAHLVEAIHCPIMQALLSESGSYENTLAICNFLASTVAELRIKSLSGLFLNYIHSEQCDVTSAQAVSVLQSAVGIIHNCCRQHAVFVPDCIARLSVVKAESAVACADDSLSTAVEALLYALLCWQQRLLLRLQLSHNTHSGDVILRLHSASNNDKADSGSGDFTVTITAHRCVLAHRSPKLAAMIRFTLAQAQQQCSDSRESGESAPALVLDLQGISEQALRALLMYMYTDSLPADAPAELLLELAAVADEYIMPSLSALLDRLLVRVLSCDNSVQCFCAAQQFQLPLIRTVSALFSIKQYGGCGLCTDGQAAVEVDTGACDLLAEALLSQII